ncbi:MAG: TerB family tellurite resistance protein, partial [Desulfobacterales bacterium]
MIDIFKRFFSTATENVQNPAGQDNEREVVVAIGALFLEMGRIDETFTESEMAHVLSLLTNKYGLSGEDADALIDEADREL